MSELGRFLGSLVPVLRVRTVQGRPIAYGDRQIIPLCRSVLLGFGRPGGAVAAGWARTRPLAVLDIWQGQERRIPIPDPTRRAMLAMTAALLLVALLARYAKKSNTRLRSMNI
jgi:uncharacterized spore protein YtfJ